MTTAAAERLSATFFALSDVTRRGILARLARGEATVGEIAEPYDMSLAAVSKHLKVLEGAGLISRGRDAQWRPCRLDADPIRDVAEWALGFESFWSKNLDSLDDYLTKMKRKSTKEKKR